MEEQLTTVSIAEDIAPDAPVLNEEPPQGESDSGKNETAETVKKYVSRRERVSYILATCSLSMFIGVASNYRNDFINNILKVNEQNQMILNVVTVLLGYALNFFITYFIDNFRSKRGKFRPLAMWSALPYAMFGLLTFVMPFKNPNSALGVTYLIFILLMYNAVGIFTGTATKVAIVMTPEEKERNSIFSNHSFFSSIASAAPFAFVFIVGLLVDKGYITKNEMYLIISGCCGAVYIVCMFNGMFKVQERIPYLKTKKSMVDGLKTVIKNKNFWWYTLMVKLRSFYTIGMGFGIYVAGAILGSTSKFLLLGLPPGIGTFVGMLIVQKLIKKTDPIKVFVLFGIYAVVGNALAFGAGLLYIFNGGTALMVLFLFGMFLSGIQFGANNILPGLFNADVVNELEMQSGGKRLEQTVDFAQGFLGIIIQLVCGVLTPFILLNPKMINYKQGSDAQEQAVTVKLLFFYTVYIGCMYAVSLLPLIGYKLNTKRRNEINAVLAVQRAERAAADEKDV